ncbi:MAG: hypothetical protein JXQ69_04715 [Paludibacteraceae bacterium]|nr:hypothetical protein [Paludibacteraceae bacterium]MBN2787610.1 hypothetical protein [Paludibacteraceae bacterium]
MKKLRLFISLALVAFGASVVAQSVVIDENFQGFKSQGWKKDTICNLKKMDSKANFKVTQSYGDNKVTYSFLKCAVAPECEAKKTPMASGVTAGYVEVNKKEGTLIISEQKFISTLEVAASATGDVRGYALFKSVKGGPWLKVGEYIGAKAEGADAQYGFINTININESDVSLKFVATMCGKDELALQTFRIHNIKAYGK